jgi:hypothetical protein
MGNPGKPIMIKMRLSRSKFFYGTAAFFAVCILSSCGNEPAPSKTDKIIAYVDKEPIFASDIQRGMALKAKHDPLGIATPDDEKDQLDSVIDKKLMIHEALRQGLARQDSFAQTIKTFWEQTLIREFVDFKKKEFQKYLFVTENEVKNYYDRLDRRVTFKILKSRDRASIDAAYEKIRQNMPVDDLSWQIIGPVGYDDISSKVLAEGFAMTLGEIRRVSDGPRHYLVMVIDKQDVVRLPLESIRPQIEKRIFDLEEERLFQDWLKTQRQPSKVRGAQN